MTLLGIESSSGFEDRNGQPCRETRADWLTTYELKLGGEDAKIMQLPEDSPVRWLVRFGKGNSINVRSLAQNWLVANGKGSAQEKMIVLSDAEYDRGVQLLAKEYESEVASYEKTIQFQPGTTSSDVNIRSLFLDAVSKAGADSFYVALAVHRMKYGAPPEGIESALSPAAWFANAAMFSAELSLGAACVVLAERN